MSKKDQESDSSNHHASIDSSDPLDNGLDKAAERRLILKVDLAIVPIVVMLHLLCFIDRGNIGNARLAGLEEDLNLTGYDFNIVLSMFYISYALCEIPSNLLCKWIGPGWFLPGLAIGFGVLTICNAFVNNLAQAAAVRFLLGAFESGVLPGIAYYLSRWYCRDELSFRLALYIISAPLAGAFGGLLASGILRLPAIGPVHTWRLIFFVEGIFTVGFAFVALFLLTDRPETARWLTPQEKAFLAARLKPERVHTAVILDRLNKRKAWLGVASPVTLASAAVFFCNSIQVQGISIFAPTIVRAIYPAEPTVRQQLLTVPPYALGVFFTLLLPYLSWRLDRRVVFLILGSPLVVLGFALFLATRDPAARYAAVFLVSSTVFSYGAITPANVSANVVSDTARSSAIAATVMMGGFGGILSMWSFLPFDAPGYVIGGGLGLAAAGAVVFLGAGMMWWMKRDNGRRDARAEVQGLGQEDLEEMDWRDPRFRWHT